ncbi:MAG: MBL fold metallo-hydrolase [Saprospiraceae bacterium]|nr:MBL fold metallo-hydrolase [Saprospiraceae bacterium]
MIKAYLKDQDLLTDISQVHPDPDQLSIWWLGQSGYLIYWNGKRIILDPYLSESLSIKYKDTDKPHVRMSEKVIDPGKLPHIDFLTSSHSHTDHLDPDTISVLIKNNPAIRFIIPESIRNLACQRGQCAGYFPYGLDAGESFVEGDISFIALPAAHESLDKDDAGKHLYLGYILRLGAWTLYHSGDTVLYPGMVEWIKPYAPDVMFLPINGSDPGRKVAGNMNASEAVYLAAQTGAKLTIPGHYHLFEFNSAEPEEFVSLAAAQGLPIRLLEHGERLNLKL